MRLYIIGGGNLSKFIIDILESMNIEIGGLYDDQYPDLINVLGYSVLGKIDDISGAHNKLVMGIGEPKERKRLIELYKALGHSFPAINHKTSFISNHAKIEQGTIIGPGCNVLAGSTIKQGACLLANVNVNQNTLIGDFALLGAGVNIGNNAVINEGCHVGMSCVIPPGSCVKAWKYIHFGEREIECTRDTNGS